MLTSLSIRDVVLIETLELEFGPGLGVLTGETGAGKSILLDALGLALGTRADSGLVRAGQAQAAVSAAFGLPPAHPPHRQGEGRQPRLRQRPVGLGRAAARGRRTAGPDPRPA